MRMLRLHDCVQVTMYAPSLREWLSCVTNGPVDKQRKEKRCTCLRVCMARLVFSTHVNRSAL